MTDERETMRDPELEALLRKWEAPEVPDRMDERVRAAFRKQTRTKETAEPFWQRLFATSIRVPVPVALAVALLLIFTAALAMRPTSPPPTAGTPSGSGPVQAARGAERSESVETGSSLAGFQPVTEVTATVVQEGAP